jgi:HAD superfamily hydrolase (TIGR01509 family)
MPGAHEALCRFQHSHKVVLATSAYTDSANCVIDTMRIRPYFDLIVTGSDVQHSKPDPESFLLSASRSGVAPSECVVIEDAEKGIVAAYRAGMKSIAIPNRHTRSNDFSLATRVLSSLDELTEVLVQSL